MKRRDGRHVRLTVLVLRPARNELRNPLFHLTRRFVRERHRQNVSRLNPARDHVRNAKRDDARLARARARENQDRPANRFLRRDAAGDSVN